MATDELGPSLKRVDREVRIGVFVVLIILFFAQLVIVPWERMGFLGRSYSYAPIWSGSGSIWMERLILQLGVTAAAMVGWLLWSSKPQSYTQTEDANTNLSPPPNNASASAPLVMQRWVIHDPGAPLFGGAEAIVNGPIRALRGFIENHPAVESYYVSKHDGTEIWLSIFVDRPMLESLTQRVADETHELATNHVMIDDPRREQLLTQQCSAFRSCIGLMTRIALDIHHGADFKTAQRDLIAIGVADRLDKSALHRVLSNHSRTYRDLPNLEAFWEGVGSNCLDGQNTDCIHWLYNVVLGLDWFTGMEPNAVANRIGISWAPSRGSG